MNIENVIEIMRPYFKSGIKESSMTTKAYRIKWILDNSSCETIQDIKDNPQDVADIVEEAYKRKLMSLSTITQTFITLSLLKVPLFSKKAGQYIELNEEERSNGKFEPDNLPPWNEMVQKVKDMPEDTYDDMLHKVILGLYFLCDHTLRLDWANVRVFDIDSVPDDDSENWLHIGSKGYTFHLNQYKTEKQYGKKIIPIKDRSLIRILDKWFMTYNVQMDYLLVSHDKIKNKYTPVSRPYLCILLGKITKDLFGVRLGNQLVRRAKETENIVNNKYGRKTLKAKKEMAEKLCHSIETAHSYVFMKK